MLKTTNLAPKAFGANNNEIVGGVDSGINETVKNLSESKKLKNTKSENQMRIGAKGEITFLNPGARKAFNQLRQAFTKALIFRHFDLKCHIRIEIDASGYAIGGVLSQLTSDQMTLNSDPNSIKFDLV